MRIEDLPDSRVRYTMGAQTIYIGKGGEDIPDNTYGFEIEFCSHDSSVFSFTHVDALHCGFSAPGLTLQQEEALLTGRGDAFSTLPPNSSGPWKIESDSGNVLELVSPPLRFPSVAAAQAFRAELTWIMAQSVLPTSPATDQHRPINAVLLGDWLDRIRAPLQNLMVQALPVPGFVQFYWRIATWDAVGQQLNEENVDDGINIPAARMRHARNPGAAWSPYVLSTVLSRSEKDWGEGYSSQLNMPMSLAGYFLYSRRKYEQSLKRRRGIENWFDDPDGFSPIAASSDATLRKNVTTSFWRSILWSALDAYAKRIGTRYAVDGNCLATVRDAYARRIGKRYAAGVWTRQNIGRWDMAAVTRFAFLYLMGSKILTGAMGALSEPGQLKLQQYAWFANSTAVMSTDGPTEERQLRDAMAQYLQTPLDLNRGWLEYHSAMKDLTGLWFKAPLIDVMLCEDMDVDFIKEVGRTLQAPGRSIWPKIIHDHLRFIRSDAWNDRMERVRPDYVDELEELDEASLLTAIGGIETALGKALCAVDRWEAWAMNDRPRKFLHYADAPPWEGRYDTMYKPIAPSGRGAPWTYLVEHRFH